MVAVIDSIAHYTFLQNAARVENFLSTCPIQGHAPLLSANVPAHSMKRYNRPERADATITRMSFCHWQTLL
eukprot:5111138-Karenia_brevis.AAC.1